MNSCDMLQVVFYSLTTLEENNFLKFEMMAFQNQPNHQLVGMLVTIVFTKPKCRICEYWCIYMEQEV